MNGQEVRNRIFYQLKPFIPRRFQLWLRSLLARRRRVALRGVWPILAAAGKSPPGWLGWPDGKQFAFILMHDVETMRGQQGCEALMILEEALGFRSSFNFVPRRYEVLPSLRRMLTEHGFEVGVHGLYHDGRLYQSQDLFLARAKAINDYLASWQAVGFCSPSSHHRLEWNHALRIAYDSSTFDTDPFEPQSDDVASIFPFWVAGQTAGSGYVELPYTLPQDFTLFVLLKEEDIDIWQRKLDWIAERGGMALLITHPDYMDFEGTKSQLDRYPVERYTDFLNYAKILYGDRYWHALPREVAAFYREHCRQDTLARRPTALT